MPDANGNMTASERAADGASKGSIGGPYGAIFGGLDGYFNGPLYKTTVKKGNKGGGGRDPIGELKALLGQSGNIFRATGLGDILAGQRQLDLQGSFLDKVLNRYPEIARREREATSQQRAYDANDLRTSGRRMQGIFESLAPELRMSGDALQELLRNVGDRSPLFASLNDEALGAGRSRIGAGLESEALRELGLGGALSPEEERDAVQSARGAWASRGLAHSNPAIGAEILNRDAVMRARRDQRRGFAGGVGDFLRREDESNRGFRTGVEELGLRETASERAFVPAASAAGASRLSPLLSLFSPRAAVSPMGAAGILGAAPNSIGAGASSIAQILGFGGEGFDFNANAAEARRIAAANNQAALTGAAIGAAGNVAGSYFGNQQRTSGTATSGNRTNMQIH